MIRSFLFFLVDFLQTFLLLGIIIIPHIHAFEVDEEVINVY